MNQDQLAQAYARLKSMKDNLPKYFEVDSKYVDQYHEILSLLQTASDTDLSGFRVPESDIHNEVSGGNMMSGQVFYSGRKVLQRTDLMMKIDAVLGFFTIKQVGFDARRH